LFALKRFNIGDTVCSYHGALHQACDKDDWTKLDDRYEYVYCFKAHGRHWYIDAKAEDGSFGRLLNHTNETKANVRTVVHTVSFVPGKEADIHLLFIAKRVVNIGDELRYDYGDRNPHAAEWLFE
jgi:hypothetical protein